MAMQQSTLPTFSHANVNEGMWYVFHDGETVIRAWGSSWTGFERVYYNDVILHRSSSSHREDQFSFTRNKDRYQIRCKTKNIQRWQVECELWKDGKLLQVIKCKRRKLCNIRPTMAHLLTGLSAGLIGGLMKMPWWFGIVFIFASLAITLLTTAKTRDFVFEYENMK